MSSSTIHYHLIEWQIKDTDKDGNPGVSVVPDSWLIFDTLECMWPPYCTTAMMKNGALPRPDWARFPYHKLVTSSTSWDIMQKTERRYLDKSDVNATTTEDEFDGTNRQKRKRKATRVLCESPATSDERASPSPPSPPLPPLNKRSSAASPAVLSFSPPPPPQRERSSTAVLRPTPPPPQRKRSSTAVQRPTPPPPREEELADQADADLQILSVEAVDYQPFFQALLRNQEEIKAALIQQRAEIHSLRNQVKRLETGSAEGRGESSSRPELPAGFTFPLEREEELRRLERELADPAMCKQLERHLYNLGGNSFRVSLRAAGGTLLASSLQGKCNLRGANEKLAFNSLTNVKRVLFNAVHERHQTPKDEFNSYLGDWLSTWRDRLSGGKKNRVGVQQKDS
ncbi:uncharacterized protein [Littorina saxatilis]|uniref:uncharacterized protein n=1 Tax=Littorina saxatilis TaxID=31220 RepID=UPI0038B5E3E0